MDEQQMRGKPGMIGCAPEEELPGPPAGPPVAAASDLPQAAQT